MTGIHRTLDAVCWLLFGLVCLVGSPLRAAEEEPEDDQLQLIIQFVGDADRETRAVGLQFIREDVPGEAATKRFAGLLPDLSPDGQVDLLDALGDRQDVAARPAVLEMLQSQEEAVRAAALGALGGLGEESDVPLLAGKAAAGSDLEKNAARRTLGRLRRGSVNAAIVSTMAEGKPEVRVVLLGVLAARNAKDSFPTVLASVEDPDPSVRLAAIEALRFLADENDTAAIVKIVKAANDEAERRKAELALLGVSNRGRQSCAEAIIAGLADADVASRIALLHGLARAGGPKALGAAAGRLDDDDEAVRDEAVRMLSGWPDPAVAGHLMEIANSAESLRHQVLAIRGLVRLASPQEDKPADLEALGEAMSLAKRPQEKRLVLGVLGGVGAWESLALVTPALDDPALVEEAGLAAVMIAERIEDGPKDELRPVMEKVGKLVTNQQTRERAQKVLQSL